VIFVALNMLRIFEFSIFQMLRHWLHALETPGYKEFLMHTFIASPLRYTRCTAWHAALLQTLSATAAQTQRV